MHRPMLVTVAVQAAAFMKARVMSYSLYAVLNDLGNQGQCIDVERAKTLWHYIFAQRLRKLSFSFSRCDLKNDGDSSLLQDR